VYSIINPPAVSLDVMRSGRSAWYSAPTEIDYKQSHEKPQIYLHMHMTQDYVNCPYVAALHTTMLTQQT